jgi:hypothetical protein
MGLRAIRLAGIVALACYACTSELPTAPAGGRISGHVFYRGDAQLGMRRPGLRVMLFADFPPSGAPFGLVLIENPSLLEGTPYAINWVPPYRYKVLGQLIDIEAPDTDPLQLPAGGYPDFCTLLRPGEGLVEVTETAPHDGVDLTLYDQAGALDPCSAPVSVCPLPGKASMHVVVQSSRTPTSNDQLRVALFQTFPSMSPTSAQAVPGASLAFPRTVIDNGLPPGNYTALYACFDVNADSGMGLCTAEDSFVLYISPAPMSFPVATIVNLVVDLDAGTVTVTSVDDPAADGCP